MHISYWKNISIWAKVSQVSDVAHGTLVFSSPELKAQVSYSDRLLSVVRLSVYIFDFFFRTAEPIFTRLGTKHPWAKGIQNCTNEGQPPSPRGDNSERVKIH
jgi:hypothetical protein